MNSEDANHHFVADGCERAHEAAGPKIQAEVEREFAARLEGAAFWEKRRIHREIKEEVRRRLHAQAPPDALY